MNAIDIASLNFDDLLQREWLATNRVGGFASSTIPSLNTRKYHGLLVAAMTPPVRRMVLLSRVEETVIRRGISQSLASNEYPGTIHPRGHEFLRAFSNHPHPRWAYQGDGWTIEKSVRLLQNRNTVVITYTLLAGDDPVELELRPQLALRGIHELAYQWNGRLVAESKSRQHHRIAPTTRTPEVFFAHDGRFDPNALWYLNTIYRREEERGYSGLEDLWSPGVVRWMIAPGQSVNFVCSTDPIDLPQCLADADIETAAAVAPREFPMPDSLPIEALVRAADQFVVSGGDRNVAAISQYPWGAPSGRDALIGFAGLFLVPGRFEQAKNLLLGLIEKIDRGLVPTDFSEDGAPPKYNGADTSLWLINAVYQYLRYSADESAVRRQMFDAIDRIISAYRAGTMLGLRADSDGLLTSQHPSSATSWMNAKVGEWVVTRRAGKTVEFNGLWFNAVRIVAELADRFGHRDRAAELNKLAARIKDSFNASFWNNAANCCFDVIAETGNDTSIRPNQLIAIGLPFPVLSLNRHAAVLAKMRGELLTPFGLRTLSPSDPNYQSRYTGNVVTRDRAYHQGSVYPWLLGMMVTATTRVKGRGPAAREEAEQLLEPAIRYLMSEGLGQLPELFDGDSPHCPTGAIASARNVGEVLRAYAEDVLDLSPANLPESPAKTVDEIVIKPLKPARSK